MGGSSWLSDLIQSWLKAGETLDEKKEKILKRFKNDGILPEEMFKDGALNIKEFTTNLCILSKKMSNVCRVQQIIKNWNEFVNQDLTLENCDNEKHRQLFAEQKELAKYLDNGLIVDGSVTQEDFDNIENFGDALDKIEIPLKSEYKNEESNIEQNTDALKIIKLNMQFIVNKENYCKCLRDPKSEGCPDANIEEEEESSAEDTLVNVKEYIDNTPDFELTESLCEKLKKDENGDYVNQFQYNRYYDVYGSYLNSAGYDESSVEDGLEYLFNVKIPCRS